MKDKKRASKNGGRQRAGCKAAVKAVDGEVRPDVQHFGKSHSYNHQLKKSLTGQ